MRLTNTNIFFILLCLSLCSCKKKVDEEYRPEFIGYWFCVDDHSYDVFTIDIDSNSYAVYKEFNSGGGSGASIKGTVRANNNHLKIGRFSSFKIERYPQKIDTSLSTFTIPYADGTHKKADWKMTLKGPLLYMGSGTYYKADY